MSNNYQSFLEAAKKVEDSFAKNLTDVVKASKKQDMYEHWDIVGKLEGETFKFEVKGQKRFNRKDPEPQDEMACIEYVNVNGYPGWVRGEADYIVFQRKVYDWLIVNRKELWDMVHDKLKERNFSKSDREWFEPKEPYATYDRSFFGKKDKFCWVPFEDIEKLKDIKKINNENDIQTTN